MNRSEIAVFVFSMLVAQAPALAQSPATGTNPATSTPPKEETSPPTRSNRDAATEADARSCLEFSSNLDVIKCAEKYRSHKRNG